MADVLINRPFSSGDFIRSYKIIKVRKAGDRPTYRINKMWETLTQNFAGWAFEFHRRYLKLVVAGGGGSGGRFGHLGEMQDVM